MSTPDAYDDAIAELDEQHANGEVADADHAERRAALETDREKARKRTSAPKRKVSTLGWIGIAFGCLLLIPVVKCSADMASYDGEATKAQRACVNAAMSKFAISSSSNVDASDPVKVATGLYDVDGHVRIGSELIDYQCQAAISGDTSRITKFRIDQQ